MDVAKIPIPTMAAIRVSKEGKSAVFETTIIQTTDNKYIYCMPVRINKKLVNFEAKGMLKELAVEFAPFERYSWRNVSIIRFVEDGKSYLRIKTTTPGVRADIWPEKPINASKPEQKESIINREIVDALEEAATEE